MKGLPPTTPFSVRSIELMWMGTVSGRPPIRAAEFGMLLTVVSRPKSLWRRLAPDWTTVGGNSRPLRGGGREMGSALITMPNLAGSPACGVML